MLCVYWLHIGHWVTIIPSNGDDLGIEPLGMFRDIQEGVEMYRIHILLSHIKHAQGALV